VFCACGQGLVVPWESTIEAPAGEAPAEASPAHQPPPLQAMPLADEPIPVALPSKSPPPFVDLEVRRRRESLRERDKCFNHQDRPVIERCADCKEGFCDDCLVKFQGQTLCGPCKNFKLRRTTKRAAVSSKAVIGLLVSLCFAPATMCLWPLGNQGLAMLGAVVALMGQFVAVGLAAIALREAETNPKISGRALVITTLVTGGLASLITISFVVFGPR
jgi:hypothetical protein